MMERGKKIAGMMTWGANLFETAQGRKDAEQGWPAGRIQACPRCRARGFTELLCTLAAPHDAEFPLLPN